MLNPVCKQILGLQQIQLLICITYVHVLQSLFTSRVPDDLSPDDWSDVCFFVCCVSAREYYSCVIPHKLTQKHAKPGVQFYHYAHIFKPKLTSFWKAEKVFLSIFHRKMQIIFFYSSVFKEIAPLWIRHSALWSYIQIDLALSVR